MCPQGCHRARETDDSEEHNCATVSADLVGSLNKRLSHHRVARGHRHNAQTQRYCPCESTHTPRRVVTTGHSARLEKVLGGAKLWNGVERAR